MVKLETNNAILGEVFYFHTMEDCREFVRVFENHWCNVPWKAPVEIPNDTGISCEKRRYMDESPKKRAEDNLSWGFNLEKRLGIGLNGKQNDFIESMIDRLS